MQNRSEVPSLLLVVALLLVLLLLTGSLPLAAQSNPVILPSGLAYNYIPVGSSQTQTVSVYNISGGAYITVNSITSNITQLKVVSGTLPITLSPGQRADYGISFTPDSATSFSGHLTFSVTGGGGNEAVNVTGNGANPAAIPTLSATVLNFPNQALGTTSKGQALTITNSGTAAVSLTGVVVTYPYSQSGWTTSTSIAWCTRP